MPLEAADVPIATHVPLGFEGIFADRGWPGQVVPATRANRAE